MNISEINSFLLPFFTVCVVGICADTVLCLAPGESGKNLAKYAKFIITLCIIFTMLTPLSKCSKQEYSDIFPSSTTANNASNFSLTQEYLPTHDIFAVMVEQNIKKELENKIISLIYENFGISVQEISIQLTEQIAGDQKLLAVSEIQISLCKRNDENFPHEQLKKYVSGLTNCDTSHIYFQISTDA